MNNIELVFDSLEVLQKYNKYNKLNNFKLRYEGYVQGVQFN